MILKFIKVEITFKVRESYGINKKKGFNNVE